MSLQSKKPSKGTALGKFLWLLVCLAILGVGVVVMLALPALAPEPQIVEEPVNIPVVLTIPLQHRNQALMIQGSGLVSPRAEITLSAQVSGDVKSIHPELVSGGYFEAGEILIEIDSRPYQANLDEAIASKTALQSNLTFLEKQVERLRSLRENSYIPEEELDQAINQRDQARANIVRQDAIILTRELDLEHSTIIAPFNGFIQSEAVDVGDIVSPGRELATFYASDNAQVIVSLNADDASFIPGLWKTQTSAQRPASIVSEFAGRQYEWGGFVERVESDLDSITRTIDVAITIPDPSLPGRLISENDHGLEFQAPPLLVGMYASVSIEGMELDEHFILPISAVHDGSIWVVDSENRLIVKPVQMVRQEGNNAVLLASDLPEGTQIITSSIALVSNGMQVRIQESRP